MLKKALSLILSIVLLSGFAMTYVGASDNNIEETKSIELKQLEAVEKNTELLDRFTNYGADSYIYDESSDVVTISYDCYPDYYGGSYIDDNGELVLLIKDQNAMEESGTVEEVVDDSVIESCEYSYSELVKTIESINSKIDSGSASVAVYSTDGVESDTDTVDYYDDYTGCALIDENNNIEVYIRDLTDEKEQWFREEICDDESVIIKPFEGEVNEETNLSGQEISNGTYNMSGAFRLIRYTSSGTNYGFVTCAHGSNDVGTKIYGYDGSYLGTVKLQKYGGAYDISYVQMDSSGNFSNTITGTPYTLANTNDDVYRPTAGMSVYLHGAKNSNSSGKITSTYISISSSVSSDGVSFSGLIGADYTSQSGDSGGLVSTAPENYSCGAVGVHRGTYGNYKVFTSAVNVINLWYMVRY